MRISVDECSHWVWAGPVCIAWRLRSQCLPLENLVPLSSQTCQNANDAFLMLQKHGQKKNSMIFTISLFIPVAFAEGSSHLLHLHQLHLSALLWGGTEALTNLSPACLSTVACPLIPLHGSFRCYILSCVHTCISLCLRCAFQPLSQTSSLSPGWLLSHLWRSQLQYQFLLTTFPDPPALLLCNTQPTWNACVSPVSYLDNQLQGREAVSPCSPLHPWYPAYHNYEGDEARADPFPDV